MPGDAANGDAAPADVAPANVVPDSRPDGDLPSWRKEQNVNYRETDQVDAPLSAWYRRLAKRGRRLVKFMTPRKAKVTELSDGRIAYELDDVVDADGSNAVVIYGSDRLPAFGPHL